MRGSSSLTNVLILSVNSLCLEFSSPCRILPLWSPKYSRARLFKVHPYSQRGDSLLRRAATCEQPQWIWIFAFTVALSSVLSTHAHLHTFHPVHFYCQQYYARQGMRQEQDEYGEMQCEYGKSRLETEFLIIISICQQGPSQPTTNHPHHTSPSTLSSSSLCSPTTASDNDATRSIHINEPSFHLGFYQYFSTAGNFCVARFGCCSAPRESLSTVCSAKYK